MEISRLKNFENYKQTFVIVTKNRFFFSWNLNEVKVTRLLQEERVGRENEFPDKFAKNTYSSEIQLTLTLWTNNQSLKISFSGENSYRKGKRQFFRTFKSEKSSEYVRRTEPIFEREMEEQFSSGQICLTWWFYEITSQNWHLTFPDHEWNSDRRRYLPKTTTLHLGFFTELTLRPTH